jgi:hypothetical protein
MHLLPLLILGGVGEVRLQPLFGLHKTLFIGRTSPSPSLDKEGRSEGEPLASPYTKILLPFSNLLSDASDTENNTGR